VASGDLLCFVDDDILPSPRWLSEMVAGAGRHPEAGSFAGRIVLLAEGSKPRTCGREPLGESELDLGNQEHAVTYGLTGGNMAIRRQALDQVGPFDATLPFYGEDTEWQHRSTRGGGTTVYLPSAWVHHRRSAAELTLAKILRRQFVKGRAWPGLAPYLDRKVSAIGGLGVVVLGLLHAARYLCWVGVFRAAYGLGHSWESVSRLTKDGGSAHLAWFPQRGWRRCR
jgi:GT2 family glycosyltransferase